MQRGHDLLPCALLDLALIVYAVEQELAAEVRGHDDNGVLEVDRAALRIGHAAVVENLQQDVEHIRVRLFDLVKQHDRVRFSANGLCELAALVVADVSGRRADESGDGELLHVLCHIDSDHVVLIIEQASCQSLCKLRFADARGAEEHERAYRPVRVAYTGTRAPDGLCDLLHGLILADNGLMQHLIKIQKLLALALKQLRDGDARPLCDDAGYLLLCDGIVHHAAGLALLAELFGLLELLFERGQVGIFEPCRRLILVAKLRVLDIGIHLLDLALELFDLVYAALFGLPAGFLFVKLILEVCKLLGELCETILRQLIGLLFKRRLLDLELHDLAAHVVKLGGHGVYLRADERTCLIDEVDGLIGQETVGYIAV